MDVEDPIDPISDDAAMVCADILTDVGVPGTFLVSGEKARVLIERGRTDVMKALARHSVGLHSDLHSVHPTLLEYMQGLSWEDSLREAVRNEQAGAEAVEKAFGNYPCAWGGPGNMWGPQITAACKQIGIPAVVYTHTRLRSNDVHQFLGVIHYPGGLNMSDREYGSAEKTRARFEQVAEELRRRVDAGVQWTEVFLGHPTRIYHEDFWDVPLYDGAMPPRDLFPCAPRRSSEALEAALRDFRSTAESLREIKGIEIVPLDEANAYFEQAEAQEVSPEEIEECWQHTEAALWSMPQWPPMPPDLDMSSFVKYTKERMHTLRRLVPPYPRS